MSQRMSKKGANEEILKAICQLDDDGSGKMLYKNLKRVTKKLGGELQEKIDEADREGDDGESGVPRHYEKDKFVPTERAEHGVVLWGFDVEF